MAEDQNKKKGLREFALSSLAVDNGTSVFILTLMIFIFGIQAYDSMPKEQFPEVAWPTVYVNTPYFGNSAADIENLVTRPIEKELQSITGIKNIRSTSIQDFSVITAEFSADMDLDDAVRKVKDAVDKAKSELPTDLDQDPTVLDINLSEIPIVTINISGDYSNDELRHFAEYLEDEIEQLDEISSVEIRGALEREIRVDVDLLKMESRQVSFADIENAIAMENITMSGGELLNNEFRRAIRVKGEFNNVGEMENMIVKSENQLPIYLKDIATVTYGYKDLTSIARSDGLPVISLDVVKRQGENLLEASDKIKVIVDDARETFPEDLKISLFNDQSVNTRNEVSNLENSIISGVILVVLVLLFFLGLRNALFVGLAIPLSMLMGILFLYLTGVTMNIVVLFSLILALGLLVDNAIVLVENIYRYMQEGYNGWDAAKYGAGEIAMPIIASTATTLAAFLPLAFWPGIMGEFMKYMPITLIIVLTSSLFVALVINTVFTSRFMKVDERADDAAVRRRRRKNILIISAGMIVLAVLFHFTGVLAGRNFLAIGAGIILLNWFILRPSAFYFQNRFLPVLENAYDRFARRALNVPGVIFGGTFVLLFAAIALLAVNAPKVIFFPSADPIYINAFVELPLGKDIEATNRVARELETRIQKIIEPYSGIVEAVLTQIGENTADPNTPPEPGASPNKARLTVSFVPANERGGVSTFEVMEKIREAVRGIPGVKITVDKNADGPSAGKPINLEIQGEDIDRLALLSEDLIKFFNSKNIPGVEELQADVKIGKPELIVNIDREAARRYEISTFDIANAIRTSVFGKEVSKFKEGEDEYPIFVRLDESYRNDIDNLLNQKITFRSPATGQISQVPISAVADIQYTSTYSSIKRKDLDRVITVYSNVLEGYNANEIIEEMRGWMEQYPLPTGYSYEFTGEQQQQAEDMGFLNMAFLIALFSIFIIIVAQFNSVSSPFIIILSVLFSTIGVFLGYAFSGRDISVIFTGVGIISLAGVVVNNAIVLIDYTNLLVSRRKEKLGYGKNQDLSVEDMKEAIVRAGATRLRPVLLTAITTVLGLIPLAVGFNFNFFTLITDLDPQIFIGGDNTAIWGPMAWTVIYGLIFATFLTLIVVPVMFLLSYRLRLGILKLFRGGEDKDATVSTVLE
ncbi:MAG: efflux RND transporter permease subunit [Lewinellaceae bacterium]|nr:efflux RND transporter permease subunit [Phaeodactylibacter sp.]MCB9041642.1 efflux RND transporter permease subunit [Lewinellaceae bacterium]